MIKFENTQVMGWEAAIRGMRNPMNSWDRSDSGLCKDFQCGFLDGINRCLSDTRPICQLKNVDECELTGEYIIGPNDLDLMRRLADGGPVHAKYRRMITVYVDITAPLYWWKEFDTYKVGTVANSCSTMHKIADKEFTLEDFSCEHFDKYYMKNFKSVIDLLNKFRREFNDPKVNKYQKHTAWYSMIQLLPSSYNQKRTVMLNYEVLAHIYKDRKYHKLDEWREHKDIDTETLKRFYDGKFKLRKQKSLNDIGFCDWIKTLPYAELITGEKGDSKE